MMGKGQKIVTTVLWALTVVGMLGLVGTGLWAKKHSEERAQRERDAAEAALASGTVPSWEPFAAPEFSLTDQNGSTVTDQTLRGIVWIADFIFTNCAGPCPKMTAMMAEFQQRIDRADVKFVSFTVDPHRDTPEVLREYAARFGADHARWSFLTGPMPQIQVVLDGMKMAAMQGQDDQITHSTYFILIDRAGQVRGVYGQTDPTTPDRLTADAISLAETGSLAAPGDNGSKGALSARPGATPSVAPPQEARP